MTNYHNHANRGQPCNDLCGEYDRVPRWFTMSLPHVQDALAKGLTVPPLEPDLAVRIGPPRPPQPDEAEADKPCYCDDDGMHPECPARAGANHP